MASPKPITTRRVLNTAIPIVLSNATVPILGAVDTGVVGQLGEAAPIGAVGLGAILLASIYWVLGFLRMGTTGLAAQALGEGDEEEVSALLSRGLLVALVAGGAFILLQAPLFWLALKAAPASAEVEGLVQTYLGIRIWGAPAAISVYALTGWLIAVERSRGVLVLQLWMNLLNIGLDVLFVLGFGWGVEGVAVATLIAEWSGAAVGVWLCRDAFRGDSWRDKARLFDRERLKRMAAVNGDIMIRSVLLQGGFLIFMFRGASLGDVVLAANQVLLQFLEITAYALDGFAFAAEAMVGQALGARSKATFRRAAVLSSKWAAGSAVLLALFFALAGPWLIEVMAKSPEVQAQAMQFLPWVVVGPLIGLPSWMFDGIFIGATRTRDMRNAMIESTAVYGIALLVMVPFWGNHGLWAALMILNGMRAITMGRRYPALEESVSSGG